MSSRLNNAVRLLAKLLKHGRSTDDIVMSENLCDKVLIYKLRSL